LVNRRIMVKVLFIGDKTFFTLIAGRRRIRF